MTPFLTNLMVMIFSVGSAKSREIGFQAATA